LNDADKELYVSRILSGHTRFNIKDRRLYLSTPRPIDRVEAQEVYNKAHREAWLKDILDEEDMMYHMMSAGLWSKGDDARMEALPEEIDDLKVALFKSSEGGNEKSQKGIRMNLEKAKKEFNDLAIKKSGFLNNTCSGISSIVKAQYLLYTGIKDKEGNFAFDSSGFWEEDFSIIEKIFSAHGKTSIPESTFRTLARTDPWRSIWNASKSEGSLFGIPASELSPEQKTLANWSKFYDSIHESPDCPDDTVIKDDDMLDGWVISQGRQRDKDKFRRKLEDKASKHPNAQEVGMVVSREDAKKVYEANNPMARSKIASRQNAVAKLSEGKSIRDQDMPVTKKEIQMQAIQESRKK